MSIVEVKLVIKKILRYAIGALTVFFFLASLLILVLGIQAFRNNEPLKIFGYTYSVVPTASMEPEIMPGDFIIAKEVDFTTIAIGDDVIYRSGERNIFIVHRVIAISDLGELTMQGINNSVPDNEVVTADNYIGKVIKHGNFLNLGRIVLNKRFALFAVVIIIFATLFITEMVKIVKTVKEKDKLKLEAEYEAVLADEIKKEREKIIEEVKKEIEEKK